MLDEPPSQYALVTPKEDVGRRAVIGTLALRLCARTEARERQRGRSCGKSEISCVFIGLYRKIRLGLRASRAEGSVKKRFPFNEACIASAAELTAAAVSSVASTLV